MRPSRDLCEIAGKPTVLTHPEDLRTTRKINSFRQATTLKIRGKTPEKRAKLPQKTLKKQAANELARKTKIKSDGTIPTKTTNPQKQPKIRQ